MTAETNSQNQNERHSAYVLADAVIKIAGEFGPDTESEFEQLDAGSRILAKAARTLLAGKHPLDVACALLMAAYRYICIPLTDTEVDQQLNGGVDVVAALRALADDIERCEKRKCGHSKCEPTQEVASGV